MHGTILILYGYAIASEFEGFEYLQPAELPSEIRMSLPRWHGNAPSSRRPK